MRTIILLVMVLLPCMAYAADDCRVIEYPDHYDVVCDGDITQTPASQTGQDQTLASGQTPDSEQTDVPPEMIVRNELARLHNASWLKTRTGQ
jgi:hypothetical protein